MRCCRKYCLFEDLIKDLMISFSLFFMFSAPCGLSPQVSQPLFFTQTHKTSIPVAPAAGLWACIKHTAVSPSQHLHHLHFPNVLYSDWYLHSRLCSAEGLRCGERRLLFTFKYDRCACPVATAPRTLRMHAESNSSMTAAVLQRLRRAGRLIETHNCSGLFMCHGCTFTYRSFYLLTWHRLKNSSY